MKKYNLDNLFSVIAKETGKSLNDLFRYKLPVRLIQGTAEGVPLEAVTEVERSLLDGILEAITGRSDYGWLRDDIEDAYDEMYPA